MKKNNLPRGLRNNNPGNIRINGDLFQGEVRPSKDKSFKQFTTLAYGYRAMFKILSNYFKNYKQGYNFYMTNWYGIWVNNRDIAPWVRTLSIWGK